MPGIRNFKENMISLRGKSTCILIIIRTLSTHCTSIYICHRPMSAYVQSEISHSTRTISDRAIIIHPIKDSPKHTRRILDWPRPMSDSPSPMSDR